MRLRRHSQQYSRARRYSRLAKSTVYRLVHLTTVPETLWFLRGQLSFMRSKGFDMHCVSSPGARLEDFGRLEHASTHGVRMARRPAPLADLVSLRALVLLFRSLRPLIVHAHTPKAGLLSMIASWLVCSPVRVYHIHGLPLMTAHGMRKRLLIGIERMACLFAHRVLCVSQSVRQVVLDFHICPANKISVLRAGTVNGIDALGRFRPDQYGEARAATRSALEIPDEAQVIGFVGRLVRDKGVDDLVTAWLELSQRFPALHMIVAGRFEPEDPVSPITEHALRHDVRVHLLGQVDEMPAVYSAMDVLILPSYREGFPYVPMEASAMAIPVVITNVPGCVDAVVDGVTGTLVPPRDPKSLAGAIARYLDDPDLRRRHGLAGRERVLRDFRPEDIWEATYQEYLSLLLRKGLSVPTPCDVAGP